MRIKLQKLEKVCIWNKVTEIEHSSSSGEEFNDIFTLKPYDLKLSFDDSKLKRSADEMGAREKNDIWCSYTNWRCCGKCKNISTGYGSLCCYIWKQPSKGVLMKRCSEKHVATLQENTHVELRHGYSHVNFLLIFPNTFL